MLASDPSPQPPAPIQPEGAAPPQDAFPLGLGVAGAAGRIPPTHEGMELQESEERFRILFEGAPDAILLADPATGQILDANRAACRMLGREHAAIVGMHQTDLHPPVRADYSKETFERHVQESQADGFTRPIENRVLRSDGAEIPVEVMAQMVRFHDRTVLMGTFRDISDRRKAEEALRESEARLRRAENVARIGNWELDLNTKEVRASEGAKAIYQLHGDAWALAEVQGYVLPEYRPMLDAALDGLIARGQSYNVEFRIRRPLDGQFRDIHSVAEFDAKRRVVFGVISDITERKRAAEALRESHDLLTRFIQHSPIYAYIKEVSPTESRVIQASENFVQMIGIQAQDMVGRTMAELFPADLAQSITADDWAVVSGGKVLQVAEELNGRSYTSIKFPVVQGGRTLLAGFTIDITDQRRAERAMKDREAHLRAIWNTEPECVKLLSPEGLLVDMNRSGLEMLEAESREEVIGKEVIGLVVPEHRAHFLEIAQRAFQEGSGFGEFEMVGLKGTRRWMETHAVPLWDEASQSNLLLAVTRDITARKLAESEILLLQAQLHQAQKMESLGSLAGGVAHDMNNVLGAILGLASAHIEGQPPGSPTHQAFATIIKAAERGATMLRSLLSFARQSSAEMRALDLNALIREEVHLLERTTLSRIHLVLDLAPDLHCMLGDASALTHALMNLCVNAVDAMPQDGTLTLRTRNLNPGWLEVQVEDTGAGMPKEVLEKALDPFFTTKEVGKGTGLGLSIVYSTVQAHHGKLDLRSEIGLGTCVTLRFPTCESATEDPHASGKFPTLASLKGLDILLVDDDELIQCSMQGVLGGLGHRVSIAPSGEEALARLEAGWTPDLVILDMNMPGLGGARTLPLLRALRPDLPVLLATGRADQTAVDLVAAHPHVTLLSKPFGMKELKAQLAAFAEG